MGLIKTIGKTDLGLGGTSGRRGRRGRSRSGGASASTSASARERGADGAELDVAVDDGGAGGGGLDVSGGTGGGRAVSASGAGVSSGVGRRVGRVEPEHVDSVVIPDGEDKNHASLEGIAHLSETAVLLEVVGVAKGLRVKRDEFKAQEVMSTESELVYWILTVF